MPKLTPDTQRARRAHILDAAERCFARSGFHRTTMKDICQEADVSPGAIYVYFTSKEALIEGICDRDRALLSENLESFKDAPDLMDALRKLGEHYAIDEPRHKQLMHVEIGVESTRNEEIGRLYQSVDGFCLESFEAIFARAEADGKIAPDIDPKMIAQIVALIGDGMFWRRAIDPDFDAEPLLPILTQMISTLVRPIDMDERSSGSSGAAPDAQSTAAGKSDAKQSAIKAEA